MSSRKKPLRLFYSRRRNGAVNFGDDISPILVSSITGRKVEHARVSQCDHAAIGSIIEMIVERRAKRLLRARLSPIRVWGSGCLRQGGPVTRFLLEPLALRGLLTRDRLGCRGDLPLGDPGILFNRLHTPASTKRHRWGVIAHYTDHGSPLLQKVLENTPNVKHIPLDIDPLETLRLIGECEHIVSSSLHGLIAADCFGIPNWRIAFEGKLDGGDYKFRDYGSAIERSAFEAIATPRSGSLDDLLATGYPDFSYFAGLDAIAARLERALRGSFD